MIKPKRKIIIVSDSPFYGGAERYIELQARAIDHDRYELILACRPDCRWTNKIAPYVSDIIMLSLPTCSDYRPRFLQLHILAFHRINIISSVFKKINPDLIHINKPGLSSGIIPIGAAKIASIPVVSTVHSPHLPSQTIMRSGRLRDPAVYLTTWLFNTPNIFVSISSQRKFEKNFPWLANDNFVVHNGLDCSLYTIAIEKHKIAAKHKLFGRSDIQVMGFMGRIEIDKGIKTLLQAFQILVPQFPDLRLIMFGDGALSKDIQKRGAGNCLDDHIVLARWVDDVDKALDSIDIFCLPTMREGFPYAILEAMAKGLPVVASAVDGIPEQVIDGLTGHLVEPRNPRELARAIGALLKDPGLASRMGQAGRRKVETDFILTDSVARTCEIYEQISEHSKRS